MTKDSYRLAQFGMQYSSFFHWISSSLHIAFFRFDHENNQGKRELYGKREIDKEKIPEELEG